MSIWFGRLGNKFPENEENFETPCDSLKIEHEFKPEKWAPGVWAGTEGLKLTVTKVDFENRKVTLEFKNE